MRKTSNPFLPLLLLSLTLASTGLASAHAEGWCLKAFRTLPWIKSKEQRLLELDQHKERIQAEDQAYGALLNTARTFEGIGAGSSRASQVREELQRKSKALWKLQQKRHSLEKRYFTVPLKEEYVGEVIGVEWTNELRQMGARVHYLDSWEREGYRVQIDSLGKLRRADGRLVEGKGIFVMDQEGTIFFSEVPKQLPNGKSIRHSSFLSGRPVAAAGELIARGGEVLVVTAKSGHYRPSRKTNRQFLERLREAGIDISGIQEERGY